MPTAKKILFLNYADTNPEDVVMYQNLSLHLSILKDKIEAWSTSKIIGGDVKNDIIKENLAKADAVIHLLSVHFENENECLALLESSINQDKKIIPILISAFDWESDPKLNQLKDKLLPLSKEPLDSFKNNNVILTEIVKMIRAEIFGEAISEKKQSDRGFYYILSVIVFLIGCAATYWIHTTFQKLSVSIMVFLMFCCVILFILRKILFPTNISSIQ